MTSSLPVMLISTETVTVTVKCPGNKGMHAVKYKMKLSLIFSLLLSSGESENHTDLVASLNDSEALLCSTTTGTASIT